MKKIIGCLLVLGILGAVRLLGQGRVIFANGPHSLVVYWDTGDPVGYGEFLAGMYFSTDLEAVQDTSDPNGGAGFLLAPGSVCPVTSPDRPMLTAGRFFVGSSIVLDGLWQEEVVVQALVWSADYANYGDALASDDAWVGASNLTAPILLAVGLQPDPFTADYFTGPIVVSPVPEPSTLVLGLLAGIGALVGLFRHGRRSR